MDFKTRKIRSTPASRIRFTRPEGKITISLSLILSVILISALLIGTVKVIKSLNFGVLLSVAGDTLETDVYGHTNFLLLGTGGEGHDGGDLTDTIMVASLDKEHKLVSMLSIPRDLYIKDQQLGGMRINEIYYHAKKMLENSPQSIELMKERVEEIVGVPIHYWVKVDFKGFTEFVDALGGIDVVVEETLYDPYYPKDGTYGYETFKIAAGPQHIDGKTALKYARSRKTTSDFDRARRQQQIIYGIKEQALKTDTIFNKERINTILTTLKENIETNLTAKEIITMGSMAEGFSQENISHRLIHDDPSQCGGFLYTPERQYYGGMYVLLPAGGLDFLHLYTDLIFNLPQISTEETKIHILNGTKKPGTATEVRQLLSRLCFNITRFGNAATQTTTETTYYYRQKFNEKGKPIDSRPAALDFLQKIMPGRESTEIPELYLQEGFIPAADLIVEIGSDYTNSPQYLKDPFFSLPAPTPPAPTPPTPTPPTPDADQ